VPACSCCAHGEVVGRKQEGEDKVELPAPWGSRDACGGRRDGRGLLARRSFLALRTFERRRSWRPTMRLNLSEEPVRDGDRRWKEAHG
jgi:hypothetical protein